MRSITILLIGLAAATILMLIPVKADDGALRGDLPNTIQSVLQQLFMNFTRDIDAISAAYCDLTPSGRRYWNTATGVLDPVAIANAINYYSAMVAKYSCANVIHYRRNGTLSAIVEQEDLSQGFPPLTAVGVGTGPGTLAYDNVNIGMALPRLCLQKQNLGYVSVTQPNGQGTDQFVATADVSGYFRVVSPLVVPPCTALSMFFLGGVCFPTTATYNLTTSYIYAQGSSARTIYFQRIFVGRNVQFCMQEIHDGDRFDDLSISPNPSVVGGPLFT